ncbi:MAG: S46 family peptidase [Bacteroidaceae bacterium]
MFRQYLLVAISLTCCLSVSADEGMYMLTDLKAQNAAVMQDMGLEIPIEEVFSNGHISLKDAVVHFGRGCTAEIISDQGLLLTNHHCGYSAIQSQSSVAHDYLTDGFWATRQTDELPISGLTITYIDKIYDVTDYVVKQLAIDPDPEGINYLSPSYLEMVATRWAKQEGVALSEATQLELKPFYGSNRYYLFIKTVYSDIRMVGAPPSSIGKFGADTDNWMWPRHTGDFSLFRIYADKEGNPAEYSKNNVPLKVKRALTINIGGVKKGDFAMILGFPGRNWRYMIAPEVKERMDITNFMREHIRGQRQQILMDAMVKDPAVRIYYASKYASSANYWKNAIGMNEGLKRLNIIDTKRQQEQELLTFGHEIGTEKYQQAYDILAAIVQKRHDASWDSEALNEALVRSLDFMEQKEGEKTKYPEVEKLVCRKMIRTYMEYVPSSRRISIFTLVEAKYHNDVDRFVDAVFADPKMKIRFANSIKNGLTRSAEEMKVDNEAYNRAHKVWVAGIMKMRAKKGLPLYPDANSTMRLTYGHVKGYSSRDGLEYLPFTTLQGVMEKEDSVLAEFTVPLYLKKLYQTKDYGRYARSDGRMPVCFIGDLDTTGGNSGSPVINGKGQLIGLNFDRNYEGLSGDIAYKSNTQRSIAVDIRYVLFLIDKYAGASRLIDEMTIVEN